MATTRIDAPPEDDAFDPALRRLAAVVDRKSVV